MTPLHLMVVALFGWLEREQREAIEFLREENRVLKGQLRGRRIRLNDAERRRLAILGSTSRPSEAGSDRDNRHTRHDSSLAP